MAFKLTNNPLKSILSEENRQMASKAMEQAKAAESGVEGQEDIAQSANQIAKSSQLDNIENKLTELSDNFSQSQEPEKQYERGIRGNMERFKDFRDDGGSGSFNQFMRDGRRSGEDWAKSGLFGGAFFKKKKY